MPEEKDFNPESMTDEDLDQALDNFGEEVPEQEPAETDKEEADTSEESDTAETEEETSEEAETTEETETASDNETPAEETEEPKLYAGKYRTIEDLETAYKNAEQLASKKAMELAEKQRLLEQGNKKDEPAPEKERDTPETPQDNAFFDEDEYNRIYYEDSPAKANIYMMQQWSKAQEAQVQESTVQRLETEAKEFNDSLARDRAKELMYEWAQKAGDRSLMDKYNDPNYTVTADDLQAAPAVLERFLTESEFIEKYFQKEPIKNGEKVVSGNGRWPKNAYKMAYTQLNHDKIIEQKVLEASENAGIALKNAPAKAKVLTPNGKSNADIQVKFSRDDNAEDVARKASKMSDADLDAALEGF